MFNQHGEFNVTLRGNILLVVITGAWNVETGKAYRESILKAIEPVKGKCWGLISNVNEWELCTPDCELLTVTLVAECKAQGLKREAVVNSSTESVKLDLFHKHAIKHTSETSPDEFKRCFFETDAEARLWLKNEGYDLR